MRNTSEVHGHVRLTTLGSRVRVLSFESFGSLDSQCRYTAEGRVDAEPYGKVPGMVRTRVNMDAGYSP